MPSKTASEDCLFLNVWPARWPAAGAAQPVMVWIPGIVYFAGRLSQRVYDGESPRAARVVVVDPQLSARRVRVLLAPRAHARVAAEGVGQQGHPRSDCRAARGCRRTSRRFGGDPKNVTIFGESAGSLDVSVLMTSPLSKGLFHRAYRRERPRSCWLVSRRSLAEAEKRRRRLLFRWKVPAEASLELFEDPNRRHPGRQPNFFPVRRIADLFSESRDIR